jgi:hypothetical protein
MSVFHKLEAFYLAHRAYGDLACNAGKLTSTGYAMWIACACGARVERWVTVEAAEDDLLRSRLLAGEN